METSESPGAPPRAGGANLPIHVARCMCACSSWHVGDGKWMKNDWEKSRVAIFCFTLNWKCRRCTSDFLRVPEICRYHHKNWKGTANDVVPPLKKNDD